MKRLVLVTAIGVMACGILACVAELTLRRFPRVMPPEKQLMEFVLHSPFRRTVPDPDVGFLAPPDEDRVVDTADSSARYHTDGRGFPNPEPWPTHPAIVVLGDSLAFGYGVDPSESFSRRLATMLPASLVNLAVSAAGPERQTAVFRKFGAALRPKLVIACLYLASDFDNDAAFAAWIRSGKRESYDTFRLNAASAKTDARTDGLEHVFEKSWLYADALDLVETHLGGPRAFRDRYRFADGSEILLGQGDFQFAVTPASANDPRLDALVASLERLRALAADGGGRLLVVLVPSKEEIFGAGALAAAPNLAAQARRRLAEMHVDVVDLYPVIESGGATRSPYFRTDIHLNEYGNRLAAEAIASWIRRADPGVILAGQTPAEKFE